jgi:hypothetical protein
VPVPEPGAYRVERTQTLYKPTNLYVVPLRSVDLKAVALLKTRVTCRSSDLEGAFGPQPLPPKAIRS